MGKLELLTKLLGMAESNKSEIAENVSKRTDEVSQKQVENAVEKANEKANEKIGSR